MRCLIVVSQVQWIADLIEVMRLAQEVNQFELAVSAMARIKHLPPHHFRNEYQYFGW